MNSCGEHRAELDGVAAGAASSEAFEIHLRECAACAAELARARALLERIDAVLRSDAARLPSAALTPAVLARVQADEARRRVGLRWWMAAAGAAVAAAVIFGAIVGVRHAPLAIAPTATATHTSMPAPYTALLDWRSPTSMLAQPIDSVLDIRSRGHLLDVPSPPENGASPGGNHAG